VGAEQNRARLRQLPSVDRLAAALVEGEGATGASAAEAISAARTVLGERRAQLLAGAADEPDLRARARERLRASLGRVLNGTGVVIHTNLGRAPLSQPAIEAVSAAARGYANVELDLDSGRRGTRDEHVRGLLCELTGAEDGVAVNNGAGAALLALAAIGGGEGVAVSRGQLVEIGGGFRVPEVLAQAGVQLIEVGTTNRTRPADYELAIRERGASAILRVHQSNFRTLGFVEEVAIETLCAFAVPVIDDLGSGALVQGLSALAEEPQVRRSIQAGAALVCFSGDKLLGGPQAGILVGRSWAIAACRAHPLARALRIGRLPLAALQATLALYRDPARAVHELPVLSMLELEPEELGRRAQRLAAATGGTVMESVARVGGGALPLLELRGPVLALQARGGPEQLAAALRAGEPPLIPRIADGRVLVDPRTLAEDELDTAAAVITRALAD
jgi:L-seryl-tRNA(Ser) seleniumtransferase